MPAELPPVAQSTRPAIDPIFVSVDDAAKVLALSPWSVYQLLDSEEIRSVYRGRRRLVDVASLREYAAGLPTDRQGESA